MFLERKMQNVNFSKIILLIAIKLLLKAIKMEISMEFGKEI